MADRVEERSVGQTFIRWWFRARQGSSYREGIGWRVSKQLRTGEGSRSNQADYVTGSMLVGIDAGEDDVLIDKNGELISRTDL